MTSPPLRAAVSALRSSAAESDLEKFNEWEPKWFRVLLDLDGRVTSNIIPNQLRYALIAPNNRRIPISLNDLGAWLIRYYQDPDPKRKSRAGHTVAYVADNQHRTAWAGGAVGESPLHRGAWFITASDDARILVPEPHTGPLAALSFEATKGGHVVARYQEENPGAVAKFADSDSSGAHTNTTN
ncbi:hypothetical protein AB3K78_15395 [Leucobacter sp. HNU]|uniref:hypothetical protein n=1 Tax=Leucobacter sp. HNU TaxID=3236805 RepID=UPI003A80C7CA